MTKEELKQGRFYRGIGRFTADIALWTGKEFIGFQFKWGNYTETTAVFGDTGFTPIEEV